MTNNPTVTHCGTEGRFAEGSSGAKRGLTEAEAAKYIGMSKHYLRISRQQGRVGNRTPAPPYIKIGRAVRYLLDDLDNWLAARRHVVVTTANRGGS